MMLGRANAFAVLGLTPGADAAAVDQAYRRLIKQYHPDREGGDGVRAAEIIRAYRELRGGKALADPLQFNDPLATGPARRVEELTAVAGRQAADRVTAALHEPLDLDGMRIHGVSPEFMKEVSALGYPNPRIKDLVAMRIHGVTAEFVKELASLAVRGG